MLGLEPFSLDFYNTFDTLLVRFYNFIISKIKQEISDEEKTILDQYIAESNPLINILQKFLYILSENTSKESLRSHLNYYIDNRRNPYEKTYGVFFIKI